MLTIISDNPPILSRLLWPIPRRLILESMQYPSKMSLCCKNLSSYYQQLYLIIILGSLTLTRVLGWILRTLAQSIPWPNRTGKSLKRPSTTNPHLHFSQPTGTVPAIQNGWVDKAILSRTMINHSTNMTLLVYALWISLRSTVFFDHAHHFEVKGSSFNVVQRDQVCITNNLEGFIDIL